MSKIPDYMIPSPQVKALSPHVPPILLAGATAEGPGWRGCMIREWDQGGTSILMFTFVGKVDKYPLNKRKERGFLEGVTSEI